jgi:REP element-mobilizing transposase RayT
MSDPKSKAPIAPEQIVDPRSLPYSEPAYRGVLPHLRKAGCTYFVTFCLADVARRRGAERKMMRESDDPIHIAESSDLEPSSGACLLSDPALAMVVEDALLHFQGERYALSAWCVMPNHVHAVVTPWKDHTLQMILKSWKGFSGHEINRRLSRNGPVWQKESFDHIVRSAEHLERFVGYVELNPVVAGFVSKPAEWRFSSAWRQRGL